MIHAHDYTFLAELLQRRVGLALGEGREYLLGSRLKPLSAALGYSDLEGLVRALRRGAGEPVIQAVCEAMATHESSFFRDRLPYLLLEERIVPELIEARRSVRRLRIWCAAASTGQEPYSVAMLLDRWRARLGGWSVEILATDFSQAALERARTGIYTAFEVQRGLSPAHLAHHFEPCDGQWRVRAELRRQVTFRRFNLLDSFAGLGTFDVVLCRNVLIYFDVPTKIGVLDRLRSSVAADGYLFLGAAETAIGLTDRFARVADMATSVYQPAERVAEARSGKPAYLP
jgi:chemotaxis protein methyltransferase CheR